MNQNPRPSETTISFQHSAEVMPVEYRLVDFGDGCRLDALGEYLVSRPCPAAAGVSKHTPARWSTVDAAYRRHHGGSGDWECRRAWPQGLCWTVGNLRLELRPTPFGHLGVFPEQQSNWGWLSRTVETLRELSFDQPVKVLNLFAYTGGSTLATALAGGHVAHVDSAKPSVEAAKRNAALSGLRDAPIRYLADDVRSFVEREIRRGNRYDMIVLDPPAYGHGKRGEGWRIERDLWPLLEKCIQLSHSRRGAILLTGHSDLGPTEIIPRLTRCSPWQMRVRSGRMRVPDLLARPLDSGFFVKATWGF